MIDNFIIVKYDDNKTESKQLPVKVYLDSVTNKSTYVYKEDLSHIDTIDNIDQQYENKVLNDFIENYEFYIH